MVPVLPVFPVVLEETALSLVEYKKYGKYKSDLFERMLHGKYIYTIIYTINYDTTLMAESEEELKSLLIKVKKESEKVGFKLNIQKTKIMASGPITSWQIDGETVETVSDFILGAPKSLQMVTAAMKLKDACSLEEKL